MVFDIDRFVEECRQARRSAAPENAIADLVREAIADPAAIREAVARRQAHLATPPMAEVFVNEPDLTIYNVAFPSYLFGVAHDHATWAVIGVYSGAEHYNVYRETDGGLAKVGAQTLRAPAVEILPADLIHDIENPTGEPSGSIHIYGNSHFDRPDRRLWRDGETAPHPFSLERSYAFGMERSQRRRIELGLAPAEAPALPNLPGA